MVTVCLPGRLLLLKWSRPIGVYFGKFHLSEFAINPYAPRSWGMATRVSTKHGASVRLYSGSPSESWANSSSARLGGPGIATRWNTALGLCTPCGQTTPRWIDVACGGRRIAVGPSSPEAGRRVEWPGQGANIDCRIGDNSFGPNSAMADQPFRKDPGRGTLPAEGTRRVERGFGK